MLIKGEQKMNEQNIELTDLEPISDVKGGCGPFHKDDAPTDIIVGASPGAGAHVK
jgi:hypothetical protein